MREILKSKNFTYLYEIFNAANCTFYNKCVTVDEFLNNIVIINVSKKAIYSHIHLVYKLLW